MDEVTYAVNLLDAGWPDSSQRTALGIPSIHSVKPPILDIRNLEANKGRRYDMSNSVQTGRSSDVIIVYEDSQTIDFPTQDWSVMNEKYGLTLHIRAIHDDRTDATNTTFGRDRLENLYKMVKYVVNQRRKGATVSVGGESKRFDQIWLGSRSESNDRNKRIFGYKLNIELRKYATPL